MNPGRAGRGNENVSSITLPGPRRYVVSHCPGCCAPHGAAPGLLGIWGDPALARVLVYYLCGRCSRRFEKGSKRARQRLAEQVEKHLKAMGATLGLDRAGLRA